MIPDFESIMLPLLKYLGDGKEHSINECANALAIQFHLTEEEVNQKTKTGNYTLFKDRLGWAKSYLKMAGLLHNEKKGIYVISSEGKKLLASNPSNINKDYLKRYPSFVKFVTPTGFQSTVGIGPVQAESAAINDKRTPDEVMRDAYEQIKSQLADDLLDKIIAKDAHHFEELVVRLLVKMGYGNEGDAYATPLTNDEGIDGVINEDKLGLDKIFIQAKKWDKDSTIGRPEIQKFIGAVLSHGGSKGVFITTARFSKQAREITIPNNLKLRMVDGIELANLMIQNNLGVSVSYKYEIKKIDSDFFDEE